MAVIVLEAAIIFGVLLTAELLPPFKWQYRADITQKIVCRSQQELINTHIQTQTESVDCGQTSICLHWISVNKKYLAHPATINFVYEHSLNWMLFILDNWYKFRNKRKEMFYLMTHSTHFIYGYIYDSEKGNPLPPHRLLFQINNKGSFICTIPQTG